MGEHDDGVDYAKLRSVELALALLQIGRTEHTTAEILTTVATGIYEFITPTKGENK